MLRLLLAFTLALALPGEELKLQVLATADTHAAVMPEDPYTLQAKPKGWARLAPLVRELQARNPHTLLVDAGDTIQGEPIAYVRHRVHPELPDPGTAILNALGAHAMVLEREPRILARVACEQLSGFFTDYHRSKGVKFELTAEVLKHQLMGEQYGIVSR